MKPNKKITFPNTEILHRSGRVLVIGETHHKATKAFLQYLGELDYELLHTQEYLPSIHKFDFILLEETSISKDIARYLFEKSSSHQKIIFTSSDPKLAVKNTNAIIFHKLKNTLSLHIDPNRDSKEDMIRWSHAILSVNSKNQFVDLAILYSPTQEKRLPFHFGPPTKSMVIFFSVITILAILFSFLLPVALTFKSLARCLPANITSIECEKNIEIAKKHNETTSKLYFVAKPFLSLFFLGLSSDRLVDLSLSSTSLLERTNKMIKLSNGLKDDLLFPKDKSYTKKNFGLLRTELKLVRNDLKRVSTNPILDYKFIKEQIGFLPKLIELLEPSEEILVGAEKILDSKTKQSIVVFFYNNMELRPGGGFIGSFFVVTVADWQILSTKFYDVYDADGQLTSRVAPPRFISEGLAQPYWFLRDSNISPDFEQNVKYASRFLDEELKIDKIPLAFAITLSAIQNLISVIGPIQIPEYKLTLTSSNFYLTTQSQIENNFFPGSTLKKSFLQTVFNQILLKLPKTSKTRLIEYIDNSLQEKNIVVYSNDSALQNRLVSLGWAGKLLPPQCLDKEKNCITSYVFPVEANVGVNKANYFVTRKLRFEATLDELGLLGSNVTMDFYNDSPENDFLGGPYRNYMSFYLPVGSTTSNFTFDERPVVPDSETDGFFQKVSNMTTTLPKSKSKISFQNQIQYPPPTGEFRLEFIIQKQIGVTHYPLSFKLKIPPNFKITGKNFPGLVKNSQILYNTTVTKDQVFFLDIIKK